MKKILIIDDDTFICTVLEKFLTDSGFQTDSAFSAESSLKKLKRTSFDLILCDYRLPDSDGMEMLKAIKEKHPKTKVIIITAYADVRMAVQLMKAGAIDYVTKPIQQEEILQVIRHTLSQEQKEPSSTAFQGGFVSGKSEKIKSVLGMCKMVAPTDMSVIIQGETGVGKEYIARTIHINSKRKDKPFIALDCGAIPKDLANSELFGHIKGSFTGAINDKKGVFEQANQGTLFLDEVGNLTYDIQVRLLRALQEKVITRVGDTKNIHVDVRIIAATNDDLWAEVNKSNFREDLYHRVNEFKIKIPPLRDRAEDIIIFAHHFLQNANDDLGKNVMNFDEDVIRKLRVYPWHGNLRELRNVIKRAVLLSPGESIVIDSLPEEIKNYNGLNPVPNSNNDLIAGEHEAISPANLKQASHEAEKQMILNTLKEVNFNKSKAARLLNIDRKTLYNKIKAFDIQLSK